MPRKIVYVVSEDWAFVSHRLSLAKQAIKDGFAVVVITHVDKHEHILRAEGLTVFNVNFSRSFKNPLKDTIVFFNLIKLFSQIKPDVVHHVGLKIILISSIATFISRVPIVINAYIGLGYVFSSNDKLAKVIREIIKPVLRRINLRNNTWTVFQNSDDEDILKNYNLINENKTLIIKGSGVDTEQFSFSNEPAKPITVMLASRLLWDKGIGEFIEAAKLLKLKYSQVRFVLVGDVDIQNPMSIKQEIVNSWDSDNVIEWWGHKQNMSETLKLAHVVVLPSYREGLPKVLLEAASVGRAIVTTDVPGCREIVKDGINGILVKIKDSEELANAIEKLIVNDSLRIDMGRKGREIVEAGLSSNIINKQFVDLYQTALKL